MKISLVVAASENNVIGKNNALLWHLPKDLKHFKNITWGMPVLMGRKTFESFKNSLPGRKNIVLSNQKKLKIANAVVVNSMKDAEMLMKEMDVKELMVIGGGEIFKMYYPKADTIYMTRVHTVIEGDAYFPVIQEKEWKCVDKKEYKADDKHVYDYDFEIWQRK